MPVAALCGMDGQEDANINTCSEFLYAKYFTLILDWLCQVPSASAPGTRCV